MNTLHDMGAVHMLDLQDLKTRLRLCRSTESLNPHIFFVMLCRDIPEIAGSTIISFYKEERRVPRYIKLYVDCIGNLCERRGILGRGIFEV